MLAIRLHPDIEDRLERLAKQTGRTKTFYAREAILEHLENLEDINLASRRFETPAKIYSAEEVKHELGLSLRACTPTSEAERRLQG
jgi:RHH-type transcriptional regulator, rel operon repressor / antitoxin RelB